MVSFDANFSIKVGLFENTSSQVNIFIYSQDFSRFLRCGLSLMRPYGVWRLHGNKSIFGFPPGARIDTEHKVNITASTDIDAFEPPAYDNDVRVCNASVFSVTWMSMPSPRRFDQKSLTRRLPGHILRPLVDTRYKLILKGTVIQMATILFLHKITIQVPFTFL
jgi:hypothetical protein